VSRTVKNKNLRSFRNISEADIRFDSWDYQWVDGGDGFLYLCKVPKYSPAELYKVRRQYQGLRTWHYILNTVPKKGRNIQEREYRAAMKREIVRFKQGKVEDVIPPFHHKNPHYCWT